MAQFFTDMSDETKFGTGVITALIVLIFSISVTSAVNETKRQSTIQTMSKQGSTANQIACIVHHNEKACIRAKMEGE